MNALKIHLSEIISGMLGYPATPAEYIILSVVAVLTCVILLRVSAGVFGLKRPGFLPTIVVFVVTTVVALGAVIAVRAFLLDEHSSAGLRIGLQIGAAVLVVLAVGIPVQMLVQSGNYLESFPCFAIALLLAALITAGTRAGLQAVQTGSKQMQTVGDEKKKLQDELESAPR